MLLEKDALVRHVLVDDPQPFAVHRHDEAGVHLPERLQIRNFFGARQRSGQALTRGSGGSCGGLRAGGPRHREIHCAPDSKPSRCAMGRSGAPDSSNSSAAVAADPNDHPSGAPCAPGISARGGPGNVLASGIGA